MLNFSFFFSLPYEHGKDLKKGGQAERNFLTKVPGYKGGLISQKGPERIN
jgi:hypothetical protein